MMPVVAGFGVRRPAKGAVTGGAGGKRAAALTAGTRRAQQVLGRLQAGPAMFVVDDQKVEAGVGAHLHNGRREDLVVGDAALLARP